MYARTYYDLLTLAADYEETTGEDPDLHVEDLILSLDANGTQTLMRECTVREAAEFACEDVDHWLRDDMPVFGPFNPGEAKKTIGDLRFATSPESYILEQVIERMLAAVTPDVPEVYVSYLREG